MRKITTNINGLYPGDNTDGNDNPGSTVALFEKPPTKESAIFIMKADENGEIVQKIDSKYIGKKLLLRIRKAGFKPISVDVIPEEYGLFYTPTLVIDYVYHYPDGTEVVWKQNQQFTDNNRIMQNRIRTFKHKNRTEKIIYYVIIIGTSIAGFLVNPILGSIIAIAAFFFSIFFTPYVTGFKKLFK